MGAKTKGGVCLWVLLPLKKINIRQSYSFLLCICVLSLKHMKKHFELFKKTLILLVVLLFISALTSCSNFLESGTFLGQLKKDIDYANAPECTLVVQSESSYGSFLVSGSIKVKAGYATDLQFTVNKEEYYFKGLEAVSSADNEVSRNAFVDFTTDSSGSDESKGIYKINVKLLKACTDILIRPVCVLLPAVTGFLPDSRELQFANVPLEIYFNMPVTESVNQTAIISALNIKSFGEDVSDYFELPEFNESGTSLVIMPKTEAEYPGQSLQSFVSSLQNPILSSITLSFNPDVTIEKEEVTFPLKSDTFTVRYKADTDTTAPEELDFFVTRHELSLATAASLAMKEKFIQGNLNLFPSTEDEKNKIRQNRTSGTFYIYGQYRAQSGIKNIRVTEQRTNDTSGLSLKDEALLTVYNKNSDNIEFSTIEGDTYFCIKHTIRQGDETDRNDGAFLMNVTALSAAGVAAETKTFTAIKKSVLDILFEKDWFGIENGENFYTYRNESDFNESDFLMDLRSLRISIEPLYDVVGNLYGPVTFEPESIVWEYEYTDRNNTKRKEMNCIYDDSGNSEGLHLPLDVDSISGINFVLNFYDDLGNTKKYEVTIPSERDYSYIAERSENTVSVTSFYGLRALTTTFVLVKAYPDGSKKN